MPSLCIKVLSSMLLCCFSFTYFLLNMTREQRKKINNPGCVVMNLSQAILHRAAEQVTVTAQLALIHYSRRLWHLRETVSDQVYKGGITLCWLRVWSPVSHWELVPEHHFRQFRVYGKRGLRRGVEFTCLPTLFWAHKTKGEGYMGVCAWVWVWFPYKTQ